MSLLSPFRLRGVHLTSTGSTIVDGSWIATNGSDSTGTGTFDNPWLTFAFAKTQVASWDNNELWIKPGTYDEVFGINFSGTTAALKYVRGQFSTNRPLFRRSVNSSRAFHVSGSSTAPYNHVQVENLKFDGTNSNDTDTIQDKAYDMRFRNCDWFNHGPGASTGFNSNGMFVGGHSTIEPSVHNIEFYDCAWYDNGADDNLSHGMYLSNGSSCVFSSCRFSSNANWGFHGYTGSEAAFGFNRGLQMMNCVSDFNGAGYLYMSSSGGAVPALFENCVAKNNAEGEGFLMGPFSSQVQMFHCSAGYNFKQGFKIETGCDNAERRNCISFGNSPNIEDQVSVSTSGNLENGTNPSWVSTSNLHLSASTSAARNIGTDLGVDFDIEGNGRIGAPDAGAYEFQG